MSQSGPIDAPQGGKGVPPVAGKPLLCLIAAVASNGVIGSGGALPWRLPEDLRYFKAQTMGHPVIMGRRTWESIGRALPGRRNIVVSRRADFVAPGASVAATLDAALAQCAGDETAWVIGGAELYREALPRAGRIMLTEIRHPYEGDVRFPEIDLTQWRETRREPRTSAGGMRFDFACYDRVR